MTLGKSLMAKPSRVTHSYRASASSVSTSDGRGADTAVRKKKKMVETGCMWILIITAATPRGDRPMGDYYYYYYYYKNHITEKNLSQTGKNETTT